MKWTYEVTKVTNRSGIRFHSGNYYKDSEGCILLGSGLADLNKDKIKDITNSKATMLSFEGFMGKGDFALTIL
jgi:hypothetical protein